ncbi:bifunctional metallophosphatase/5'-nucleotidase [Paenibacillus woosongensis]|uniref:Bifunctional metallophosphatase/5'-nucleotidase n=1 Tax=Paenibacillus woosongensis TaxID=307580 RepID=A0A7X2Z3I8_9BACL|nr:bifunctional metallophosphatase/5'-nucleotidase [Paenibacillus woosongensis]MUG46908.1 bifunctional metallophosphatase/5'-nucleotidase [Paenibacillus woosongensis]
MNKTAACEIEILVTSDIHGHIYPTDYRTAEDKNLGLAKIASLIQEERRQAPDLLLLDNGDLIQGSPMASYDVKKGTGATHPAAAVLNRLSYDAAVPGNHEFNYGQDVLRRVMEMSEFPWLSANIIDAKTGEPAFGVPYIIKQRGPLDDPVKVAILGLTTQYIPNWENPLYLEGLEFRDAIETAKAWVSLIRKRERPDLLVVCYHGGFERDLASGEASEKLTGENQGYALCREVEGIDVLITGHQHRFLATQLGDVTVVQPGSLGQALGKVVVCLEKQEEGWIIRRKTAELLLVDDSVNADRTILEMFSSLEAATQSWLDQPIGQVAGDMRIHSPLICRTADHPFIEFVNKVQMEAAGAAVSCAALLSEESRGFGTTVTMRDVLGNFMYPNTLTVLRLKGKDIRDALEQTAAYFVAGPDGRPTVSSAYLEPKAQHYNYDMWEGIRYELDPAKPLGQRVMKLTDLAGNEIEDETEMDVVMNSYRAGGGGDYEMFKGKPVVREIAADMAELVAEYIRKHRIIQASCDHNWRVIAHNPMVQ